MADDSTATGEPPSGSAQPAEPAADRASQRRSPLVAVGVLAVLLALVAAGIWFQSSRSDDDPADSATTDVSEIAATPVDEGMSFATGAGPIIDIYVDYQCSHCADLEDVIGPELERIVAAEEVELVLRPVRFLSRASGRGAAALYCAADAGQALGMHQQLLSDIAADFSRQGLTALAAEMGLDEDAFGECLTADATATWVNGVTDSARSEGVAGTPAVFLDGTRLSPDQLASGPAFREAVLGAGA